MKYLYYPGCSLKSSGKHYEISLLAVLQKLGIEVEELENWNCCGATNYMSINENYALEITARNLGIAEKQGGDEVIVPCAACFMGFLKTQKYMESESGIRDRVNQILNHSGLSYNGKVQIRHPLDLLVNQLGADALTRTVEMPLKDLKVASYYGCQLIRPYATFDDQWNPHTMDDIARAMGATPVDWPLKSRCCSGSMTSTMTDIGLRMNYVILKEAKSRGADVIITACPLCQFNLECFQGKISRKLKDDVRIPVMYFTQLMGLAMGIPAKKLGLKQMLSPSLVLN
ncbi:MAG TPA: CoB--CoM heterodisulfide reductase iron-sulfur subunit B family protein [Bacteroidales bacterium]|nr:CoB--CoM heterodisulfide reductase iron-sulfur subunit B family protein [Bacteroidales bacterium]